MTCACFGLFGWKRVSGFRTMDGTRNVDYYRNGIASVIVESTLEGLPMRVSTLTGLNWTPWIERVMPARYWNGHTYQTIGGAT